MVWVISDVFEAVLKWIAILCAYVHEPQASVWLRSLTGSCVHYPVHLAGKSEFTDTFSDIFRAVCVAIHMYMYGWRACAPPWVPNRCVWRFWVYWACTDFHRICSRIRSVANTYLGCPRAPLDVSTRYTYFPTPFAL